jgi:hypothetical protein
MTNMTTGRDKHVGPEPAEAQFKAILERVLRAFRDERHGGGNCIGERILDGELVPVARAAFLEADDVPPDHEVLQVLDGKRMHLLGEGYHVIALAEPAKRFVVKYAKNGEGIPPLAPPQEQPGREEWAHDHGIQPDGSLQPTIWQHIRSLEVYGPLAVPNRVYLAESAYRLLNDDQRRSLERFRSIGIVRSLGSGPRTLRVDYPDDFPNEKRAPDGVEVSVLVIQPFVTPLEVAIEWEVRACNLDAARDLKARYMQFVHALWRYGISHLDFSILNVGSSISRSRPLSDGGYETVLPSGVDRFTFLDGGAWIPGHPGHGKSGQEGAECSRRQLRQRDVDLVRPASSINLKT